MSRGLKNLFFLIIYICLSSQAISQGTIRGKIIDENGEDLIGVFITPENNEFIGTTTDFDGTYSLELPDSSKYTLVISYVGFADIKKEVQLRGGQVEVYDFTMNSESVTMETVVITTRVERGKEYFMESIKKKSATTLDYMPAALMKKLGDSNIASAVSRVSGVSTNGSFITVRGMGDRYVKTAINGSIIPTLDPFTNNIKLDLFPASLVDNVIITKTNNPDLPGDWSAAYISVETKDYPDELQVNISTTVGYNPQTHLKEIIATETSATDWLGFDNDFREVDHSNYVPVNESPTRYQELSALGLKEFYKNLGVTESWSASSEVGETYFKLGLIEMGFLGEAYINDETAVSKAKAAYFATDNQNKAFKIINKEAEANNASFANNWSTIKRKAPLNFSQNFSIGNRIKFFGKELGYIAGVRYSSSVKYDPNSTAFRTLTREVTAEGEPAIDVGLDQQFVNYDNGWTGLINTNLKWNSNNSFSLLFMPNMKGVNKIRNGVDTYLSSTFNFGYLENQYYEERSQFVYQYKSEHYIPGIKAKIKGFASYADGESTAPDFKEISYFTDDNENYVFDKSVSNINRNFRYLDENVFDGRLFVEIPLSNVSGSVSKLKFGGGYLDTQRDYAQYDYRLELTQDQNVGREFEDPDLNNYFTNDRFNFTESNGNVIIPFYYTRNEDPANFNVGHSKVYSGFALWDKTITSKFRAAGGLRVEHSDIFADVTEFARLGYAPDDPRRRTQNVSTTFVPGSIKQTDFLPSVNLIYKLIDDPVAPTNLRLNYSRSLARPSIREISEVFVRDFELNADVFGNPNLKIVQIDNMDFRFEKYFKNGDNLSLSLFYKNIKNHIELISSAVGFTWVNADNSYAYGLELEGKKRITEKLEFRTNISIVSSQTEIEVVRLEIVDGIRTLVPEGTQIRSMYGQAPFVINGILNYDDPKIGLNATLSYNVQGPKLVFSSINTDPDVYEMPLHSVNFKVSKSLNKHFSVNFLARNILNGSVRRSYKYDTGYLLDFDKYTYGTTYNFGVSYKLK